MKKDYADHAVVLCTVLGYFGNDTFRQSVVYYWYKTHVEMDELMRLLSNHKTIMFPVPLINKG